VAEELSIEAENRSISSSISDIVIEKVSPVTKDDLYSADEELGCRTATKFLLTSGANIHARTSSGLGVLELGHNYSVDCKQDEKLFAQIMLCMSLATSFGAVSEPTILDEWHHLNWELLPTKLVSRKVSSWSRNSLASKLRGDVGERL
jgi:hypothetical protein